MIDAYFMHILIIACIYMIVALALQLTIGYAGILNLAHISFFGVGAFASALLSLHNFNFFICFGAAGLAGVLCGYLVFLTIKRFQGDFVALVSMVFAYAVYSIMMNWQTLTHGPYGLAGIPDARLFGISFGSESAFLILALSVTIAVLIIIVKLVKSPYGRVIQAMRDDALAARTLGKDVTKLKLNILCLSGLFSGLAGSLFSAYMSYINPSSFTIMQLMPILAIVILGGLASIRGTVVATFLIIFFSEGTRFIGLPNAVVGPARQLIYSLILIIVLLIYPMGIWGKVKLR